MDIEPLWALGGWSSLSNCMAEPNYTTPSSSSSSPISECFCYESHIGKTRVKQRPYARNSFSSKSPFSLHHLLTLVFIFLLLINLSQERNPSPTMVSSSEPAVKSSESSTTTSTLYPTKNSHTSSSKDGRREFGHDAHEVPSGPNPISNR